MLVSLMFVLFESEDLFNKSTEDLNALVHLLNFFDWLVGAKLHLQTVLLFLLKNNQNW